MTLSVLVNKHCKVFVSCSDRQIKLDGTACMLLPSICNNNNNNNNIRFIISTINPERQSLLVTKDVTECMLAQQAYVTTHKLLAYSGNCKLIKLLACSWNSMQPLDNVV